MLYRYFQDIASEHQEKTAVVEGDRRLSYKQLTQAIESLAQRLRAEGVTEGEAVMLLLPNGVEFVIATFAVLAVGAIGTPVNCRFSPDEIEFYLETSQARLILHGKQAPAALDKVGTDVARLELPIENPTTQPAAAGFNASADRPALYMYSSGSTGKPKRVTRTQSQLLAEYHALAATITLTAEDRILCSVPLYHAHGFNNCLMAALLSGGTLILATGEFNPRDAVRLIERERITIYPAVPFMFKMMGEAFYATPPDLSGVRLLFSAGAALPIEVNQRFRSVFGQIPRQLYGSTETGAVCINYDWADGTETSVGRPLKGIQVDILTEGGEVVPDGETGEIAIRSPAMTRAYDGLPEITEECFRAGYFLPGDLGFRDGQGRVHITGRKKLLINVAGNKVDPLDVELVLKSHSKVKDAVVVGQPHPIYGELVKAVVVANTECDPEELVTFCGSRLAEYKVPKVVEFRDEIPRSPLGKILRKYL